MTNARIFISAKRVECDDSIYPNYSWWSGPIWFLVNLSPQFGNGAERILFRAKHFSHILQSGTPPVRSNLEGEPLWETD